MILRGNVKDLFDKDVKETTIDGQLHVVYSDYTRLERKFFRVVEKLREVCGKYRPIECSKKTCAIYKICGALEIKK